MTATSAPPHDPLAERRLADDLQALLEHANGQPVTLGEILDVLGDRGHAVMILLLSAPFLVNPIPALSTAFGLAIGILGVCVLLNLRPWLPAFIRRRSIGFDKLRRILHAVEWVLKKIERFARPRLRFLSHRAMHPLIGLTLLSLAFLLALPIPIPFNNVPPAIGLVVLAIGMLERDGVLVLIGHLWNLAMWLVLLLVGNLLLEALAPVLGRLGWTTAPTTQQALLDCFALIARGLS
jgi:hypothetical protein